MRVTRSHAGLYFGCDQSVRGTLFVLNVFFLKLLNHRVELFLEVYLLMRQVFVCYRVRLNLYQYRSVLLTNTVWVDT